MTGRSDSCDNHQTALSRLLREADPVRDGGELAPETVARMRRSVLRAAREAATPAPARVWRFALAAASVAGAVLALLWAAGAPQPVEPPRVASLAPGPPVSTALPAEALLAIEAPARPRPPQRRPAATHAVNRSAPAPEHPGVARAERRQIHLQSPSGIRVVWVLDPDFSLDSQGDAR